MALSKQKAREILFQILYSYHFISDEDDDEMLSFIMHQYSVCRRSVRELMDKRLEIVANLSTIDEKIALHSASYEFHRIAKVELSVLRLALFEMMYASSAIPPKVSIAEAIRLTRKYSSPESASFINAVLDKFYKNELQQISLARQEDEYKAAALSG